MINLTVLGATGSVGKNTLDIVRRHSDKFSVFALSANTSIDLLKKQAQEFQPRYIVVANPSAADALRVQITDLPNAPKVLVGEEGLVYIASHETVDAVMAAIVGAAGVKATFAAASTGKKLLLANKEALVCAGSLIKSACAESGAILLPIDSEHNALYQCLPVEGEGAISLQGVRKLILTGSGGPFRGLTADQMATKTPIEACNHPNWSMGQKISVDSATWMNKGLEYIEASCLFDLQQKQLEVLIHPESVVHSMVEYVDGSVLAHLGHADMRTPIAHALAWPERIESGTAEINFTDFSGLTFEEPDTEKFPCLKMAMEVDLMGGSAPIALNAANEIAVEAFLQEKIRFGDIAPFIQAVLDKMPSRTEPNSIDEVLEIDSEVRRASNAMVIQ